MALSPVVASSVADVRHAIGELRSRSSGLEAVVGLVPTMGALHDGHASLIRVARRAAGVVVVSIFVNPQQFGPAEDFSRYPRSWDADVQICAAEGADLIFAPDTSTVYPPGFQTSVEVADLQKGLCGASRPGHFRGVATVVLKLFNAIRPDIAFFGQKDAQQCRIVQQLVRDLELPVHIQVCPTIREPDGLALSSRNKYLDARQRTQATVLHRALTEARRIIDDGERSAMKVMEAMAGIVLSRSEAVLDYAAVVEWETLRPLEVLQGEVLLALAVKLGQTRLIDNMLVHV